MNMEVVVFGTGMYVIGRGVAGFGTIIPAITEFCNANKGISVQIKVICTSEDSRKSFLDSCAVYAGSLRARGLPYEIKTYIADNVEQTANVLNTNYKADIRAAVIAIPDDLHYDYIKLCGRLGYHTLTVKPFVEFSDQAYELVSYFQSRQLYGAVEFHKRYDESNIVARDIVSSGDIGRLSSVVVEYSQKITVPTKIFRKWAHKTNIFQYLGVHYVDQVAFVTAAAPTRVMAVGTSSKLNSLGIDSYDEIIATVEWALGDNTFFAVYRVGWIDNESSTAMSTQRISYYGTEGYLHLDQTNRGIELLGKSSVQHINPYFSQTYGNSDQGVYSRGYGITSIKSFLEDVIAIFTGEEELGDLQKKRPSFAESVVSVAVSEAVSMSLVGGSQWVEIK